MDTTEYEKLLQAAIRFVSYRPRSEKEIRDFLKKKLKKWKVFGAAAVDKVIARLTELGYVDDAKFAAWWVEQRQTFNPKGKRLIAHELKAKGVGLDDVNIAVDEVEAARQAVQKKLSLWEKLPSLEQKKKIYAFLGRRGFDGETIGSIIDEIAGKE